MTGRGWEGFLRAGAVLSMTLWALPGSATALQTLVISEVSYDRAGADNGFEWVELFNPTSAPIDLSGSSLGSAGDNYASSVVGLSGIIEKDGFFVVGGPDSDVTNGSPLFDLIVDFSPDIQNAGATADGVALFDLLPGEITAASVPLDAVIYGGSNDNQLIDADGLVLPPLVADAPGGSSLERLASRVWIVNSQPGPGVGPLSTTSLPAPSTLMLVALGLCFLPVACPKMESE